MKVLAIFGTRPEAIKMAPLVLELQKHPSIFKTLVCVSAQHRQMLDQVLELFQIKPDFDLDLMQKNQSLAELNSRILLAVTKIIDEQKPDRIIVQGDTTTAFASSLAAFYKQIPIDHIEAGLRTWNFKSPWPEEMNRVLISRMADQHFAPTTQNKENLLSEKIPAEKIFVTGNTVIDALLQTKARLETDVALQVRFKNQFDFLDAKKKMILVTGHRRENFGSGMKSICDALLKLAERDNIQIVYPVHLNPNVQQPVNEALSRHPRIFLIPPVDYLPFIYLMSKAHFILTDSGGLQEEAPSLGKPVLVMRDTTERQEGVEAGTVRLVGTERDRIYQIAKELLDNEVAYVKMSRAHNPYGSGDASARIVKELMK